MPAPVECQAEVFIQEAVGTHRGGNSPVTILSLRCEGCPDIKNSFISDPRYFDNPRKEVMEMAGEFLGRSCGLKTREGQAVILPPELGRQSGLV